VLISSARRRAGDYDFLRGRETGGGDRIKRLQDSPNGVNKLGAVEN